MFKIINAFLLVIIVVTSCNENSAKENELLKQELKQKDKELELKAKEAEVERQKDSLKSISPNSSTSLADKYEVIKNSIYLIYTTDDINVSQGSAFIINSNGDAISNYHVFENMPRAIAINSQNKKFVIDKIYTFDKEKDYIIFRIGPNFNDFTPLTIANELPRIGDECFAVGNPMGLSQSLSKGIISGFREDNHLIQTTAQITHGSSGGALFNNKGEVIGITSSGMGTADLNFAINIKDIPIGSYLTNSSANLVFDEDAKLDDINHVKETINGYFTAMLNRDYFSVKYYLNDILDRCYIYYNISKEDVVIKDAEYKNSKGIVMREINIDWASLKVIKKNEGYSVSFNTSYSMTRTDISKPTEFNLKLFVELTNNFKIISIYENILNKI